MTTLPEYATCPCCGYKPGLPPPPHCPECGSELRIGYLSPWGDASRRWVSAMIWCEIALVFLMTAMALGVAWNSFSMINDVRVGMSPVSPTPLISGWSLFIRPWQWLTWVDYLLLGSCLPLLLLAAIARCKFMRSRTNPAAAKSARAWALGLFVCIVACEAVEASLGFFV